MRKKDHQKKTSTTEAKLRADTAVASVSVTVTLQVGKPSIWNLVSLQGIILRVLLSDSPPQNPEGVPSGVIPPWGLT